MGDLVRRLFGGYVALPTYRSPIVFFALCFLCSLTAFANPGGQDNDCIIIESQAGQPINLNRPGKYCLKGDLEWSKSVAAIVISASHTKLDFRGYKIRGNQGVDGQIALLLQGKVNNITIENGVIQYFNVGLRASDVKNIVIKKMKIDQISWIGSHLSGKDILIEQCTFSNIGYKHGAGDREAYAVGVLIFGKDISILNNVFNNVIRPPVDNSWVGEGVSILISEGSKDITIHNNSFYVKPSQRKTAIGVWLRASDIDFRGNTLRNFGRPIEGHFDGTTKILNNNIVKQ